jgi:hypothetical protein
MLISRVQTVSGSGTGVMPTKPQSVSASSRVAHRSAKESRRARLETSLRHELYITFRIAPVEHFFTRCISTAASTETTSMKNT